MVDLSSVPLEAISAETKHMLAVLLNPPKVIPASNGLLRDWRGFAHICKITGDIFNAVAADSDSFNRLLSILIKTKEYTLLNLKEAIEQIERYDVIQDTTGMMEKDANLYLERREKSLTSAEQTDFSTEAEVLTIDDLFRLDRGEKNQHYDAFLLYADEDADFAMEMIENLETKNNLKLCLKDRDLVAGITFEHVAIMKLISERCNRLIAILSPEFLNSDLNQFFINFAQAIGIDKKQERKIIPCIYKKCELPPQLVFFSKVYYNKPEFFWSNLVRSMKALPSGSNQQVSKKSIDKSSLPKLTKTPCKIEEVFKNEMPIKTINDELVKNKLYNVEEFNHELVKNKLDNVKEVNHELFKNKLENAEEGAAADTISVKSLKSGDFLKNHLFFWSKKRKAEDDKEYEKEKTKAPVENDVSLNLPSLPSLDVSVDLPSLSSLDPLDSEANLIPPSSSSIDKVRRKKKWNPIKKVKSLLEK